MPLHIVEENITKIKCDAIVNAANPSLLGGGGVDGAIHRAAGSGLLAECRTLGGCDTGDAKITKGYLLPCKFVIHTVGPIWRGGSHSEKSLLTSCYRRSLELAREYGCESVAFPLISSGAYGYPKAEALSVAVNTIAGFLLENDMTVYVTVFNRADYLIDEDLYDSVKEYIADTLTIEETCGFLFDEAFIPDEATGNENITPSLEDMLSQMEDNFAVTLFKLIDLKGMTDVQCYKKANVSRQTWYKIMNEKDYRPSKSTVLCFAIALELSLKETEQLLSTVGFALSKSSKADIIIEYFIINGKYDIFLINQTLFKFEQPCLGV